MDEDLKNLLVYLHWHMDIIFAFTAFVFIFVIMYGNGAFQMGTLKNLYHPSWDNKGVVIYWIWIVPLILYAYYPVYSIWRKREWIKKGDVWFSRFHTNVPVLAIVVALMLYLLFFWRGGALFHPNELAGMLSWFYMDENIYHNWNDFIQTFYTFLYPLLLFAIWEGSIGIYPTHKYAKHMRKERIMEEKAKRKVKIKPQPNSQNTPQPKPQSKQSVQMEIKERLKRLKELLDEGLISEEDYKRKKEEILKGL